MIIKYSKYREMRSRFDLKTTEQFYFVPKGDFKLTGGQSLSMRLPTAKDIYKVGDVLIIAPRTNKSGLVEAAIIKQQEHIHPESNYYSIIAIPYTQDYIPIPKPWSPEFIKQLKDGLYLVRSSAEKPKLEIELSLDEPTSNIDSTIIDSTIIDSTIIDSTITESNALDNNMDGKIDFGEAKRFEKIARASIASQNGLKFRELAPHIPSRLIVKNIEYVKQDDYTLHLFDSVALRFGRKDGIYYVDIPFCNVVYGKAFNSVTEEVYDTVLQEEIKDSYVWQKAKDEFTARPFHRSGGAGDDTFVFVPLQWLHINFNLSIINKDAKQLLMNSSKIEMIKKIKKCGKKFYRLIIQDDWRSIHPSPKKYDNCLLTWRIIHKEDW